MTDVTPAKPFWLRADHIIAAVPACVATVMLIVWLVNGRASTDNTQAAMVTVNSRLDRIFVKLDDINASLPVLVEKVRTAENQITEGRGSWASLDVRLRAIEQNAAANHADIEAVKPNPRHINPAQ